MLPKCLHEEEWSLWNALSLCLNYEYGKCLIILEEWRPVVEHVPTEKWLHLVRHHRVCCLSLVLICDECLTQPFNVAMTTSNSFSSFFIYIFILRFKQFGLQTLSSGVVEVLFRRKAAAGLGSDSTPRISFGQQNNKIIIIMIVIIKWWYFQLFIGWMETFFLVFGLAIFLCPVLVTEMLSAIYLNSISSSQCKTMKVYFVELMVFINTSKQSVFAFQRFFFYLKTKQKNVDILYFHDG